MFVAHNKADGRYRVGKWGSTTNLQKARTFVRRHDAERHASYWGNDGVAVEVELTVVVNKPPVLPPDEVILEVEIAQDFPRFQYSAFAA